MLISVEMAQLELVSGGGQNTVTTRNANGEQTSSQTDYAYCVDKVAQACRTSNPGMLWGTNETKAAQCQVQAMPVACGLPPKDQ
jgi:hypothetical protein